jgi:xylose isomerase
MDAFARGLKNAAAIRADGRYENFLKDRYSSWDGELGAKIESGNTTLSDLETHSLKQEPGTLPSGRQEMLENLLNNFI